MSLETALNGRPRVSEGVTGVGGGGEGDNGKHFGRP